MKIVKVQGGSGNQLFQASKVYPEFGAGSGSVILHTRSLRTHKTKMDFFAPAWSAFETKVRNDIVIRVLLKLDRFPSLHRLLKRFNITCVQGYFQEQISVPFAKAVLDELTTASVEPTPRFDCVIHCRGGDYLEPPNNSIYKQLSLKTYSSVLDETLSNRCAVIGNHSEFTKALCAKGAVPVSGSIVDDLLLMGAAKHVVCSNSTFACWGAMFCLLNGGRVTVPRQYYFDAGYSPNPFDILASEFPGQVTYFGEADA